jgi:uncharacterized membrane protein YfcA
LTGLLANGGGFLLVPLFVVLLGLSAGMAAGTSMVAVGALTIPTLAMHTALGHVDWALAIALMVGVLPGSYLGASMSHRIPSRRARQVFGAVLIVFAISFLIREVW